MTFSKYVVQFPSKALCPKCDHKMWWLCPYNCSPAERWFMICFKCEVVVEAGVGPVRKIVIASECTEEESDGFLKKLGEAEKGGKTTA